MKKVLSLTLCLLALAVMQAQNGEKNLNRRYMNDIRDSLNHTMLARQQRMQRYAERTLASLPNELKLYDESYINVSAELADTVLPNGEVQFDLIYRLSYNCRHLEGYTDDYPLGAYGVEASNSCRAICGLTKHFMSTELDSLVTQGKNIDFTIFSTADGTEFNAAVPYDGRFGDFRYCPVVFNGERLRVSVDRLHGISNNCQLAYLRAYAVRAFLESNVPILRHTQNNFQFVTQSFKDSSNIHYYRRSSIEMRVHDVEHEVVARHIAALMQDDFVDYNIPRTSIKNKDAYVLIIANENYSNALVPDVPYALNDGEITRQYFIRALGVPERQVKLLTNASKAQIKEEGINWLTDIAQAVADKSADNNAPRANIFIYFAGHGFADLAGNGYLVPNDLNTDKIKHLTPKKKKGCCRKKKNAEEQPDYDITLSRKESERLAEQCVSLAWLADSFKPYPITGLTIIADATFNGTQRNGEPLFHVKLSKKQARKKARKQNLRSDAVVLLASEMRKNAFAYDQYQHGFLTYFLLKEVKLQGDNIFNIDYQDIYESVAAKVSKESALQNRWQEISGIIGGKYKESWQRMKVK